MLDKDVKLVNAALTMGFVTKEALEAWSRIKKEIVELSKTPTNKQSESLLCSKCGSNKINYSSWCNENWCEACDHRWKA